MADQQGWHLEDADFAITFLETAQRDYEHALHMRAYYAENALKHGVSKAQIAEIYGLPQRRINKMIKRAGDRPT